MYKYEYVKIHNDKLVSSVFTKHRAVIAEYAEKGYRYVGFIPIKSNSAGKIREMDLIFETQE